MKSKKMLKIAGIIFVVAALLFVFVLGIIALINKEKPIDKNISDFTSSIENDTEIYTTSAIDNVNFEEEINFLTEVNTSINGKYDYYRPNFSSIGANAIERKNIKKSFKKIAKLHSNLKDTHNSIKAVYESESALSEQKQNSIRDTFYNTYLKRFHELLAEKNNLVSYLEKIVLRHDVLNTPYIENVFVNQDIANEIAIKINLPHLIEKEEFDYSAKNTLTLLTKINTYIDRYKNGTLNLFTDGFDGILVDHANKNDEIKKAFVEFKSSLKKLNNDQLKILMGKGSQEKAYDFVATKQDSKSVKKVAAVCVFLKAGGIYEKSATVSSENPVMVGIEMNKAVV